MSALIFLDIDGVLNNMPWMNENGFGTLDPTNVQRLVRLVEWTGADIVISSDWRRFFTYDDLCRRLRDYGVPDRFLGVTPQLEDDSQSWDTFPRGLEIKTWLETHEWTGSFVILDDRSDMEPYLDRLVLTDQKRGLTETDIKQALSILTDEAKPV